PQLLLLDEPASGISQKETESLGPLLRRIKQQTGCTMLVIEHDMPLVMGLSDYVYCLDAGRNLAEGPPEVVQADDRVIEAYLGTAAERQKVSAEVRRKPEADDAAEGAETLLEFEGVDVFYERVQVLYGID